MDLCSQGRIGAVKALSSNDTIRLGAGQQEIVLKVLNPPEGRIPTDAISSAVSNDLSVVLQIQYGRSYVLLAGDIEKAAWTEVLAHSEFRPPHVLKVSHHGAKISIPPGDLLSKTTDSPRWALLSTGSKDEKRPHPDVLRLFWSQSSWKTRCTGWSPFCATEDQERYPVPADDPSYPQSLKDALAHSGRSLVYEDPRSVLGCCVDNEVEVFRDGMTAHQVREKSCDTRLLPE